MDLFSISKPLVIYFICPALTAISRYLFNVFVSMPSFLESSVLLSPSRYGLSLIYLFVFLLHIAFIFKQEVLYVDSLTGFCYVHIIIKETVINIEEVLITFCHMIFVVRLVASLCYHIVTYYFINKILIIL